MENDPPQGSGSRQQTWQQQQAPRGMGMRVEETHRGLSVTHIVPGGQGEKGGLQVCAFLIMSRHGKLLKQTLNLALLWHIISFRCWPAWVILKRSIP